MKTFTIDPAQFLVETMHMNTWEIGAYVLLMANQAAREKPILVGHARTICRLNPDDDLTDVLELFGDDGEVLSHPGIAGQIAERDRTAEANVTRAKAGAAARHGKKEPYVNARGTLILDPAPVAQRIEHGDSTSIVAGSNPAGRSKTQPELDAAFDVLLGTGDLPQDVQDIIGDQVREHVASLGTVLDPGFALTGTMIAEAKVKGVDDMGLLADMFDEFRRYHISAGTLALNWHGSWEKWFDRKKPRRPRAAPRVQVSNQPPGQRRLGVMKFDGVTPAPIPTPEYEPDVPDDD